MISLLIHWLGQCICATFRDGTNITNMAVTAAPSTNPDGTTRTNMELTLTALPINETVVLLLCRATNSKEGSQLQYKQTSISVVYDSKYKSNCYICRVWQ